MKVLTLTTQYANNYGALLQCYALSRYLNNIDGIECKVIDYHPIGWERSWKVVRKPRNIKEFAKTVYSMTKIGFVKDKHAKNKLMKGFIKDYIPLTDSTYNREDIKEDPPEADIYICGSDQIWNQTIFKDLTYYLDFVKNGKRVSYAASIADPWKDDFERLIRPELNKFDALSVREKGNIPQAQKLVNGKKIEWVIDPVFLLGKQGWDKIVKDPQIKEPYIFCYFLNVDPFAVDVVNKLRTLNGCKVVNLAVDSLDKFHSDILIRRADPCTFIGLIKNASYICTNSFHCSAFSTIYEKRFSFIPKTWANERIVSLQEIFEIDVIMTKEKAANLTTQIWDIDYSKGADRSNALIDFSKKFLNNAIYGE